MIEQMNFFLIPMTHWFCVFRMPEMAIVNMLAMYSMNYNTKNRPVYNLLNLMNGIITYVMGYTYFLRGSPSSGVYSFFLGILCIICASQDSLSMILDDWNSRFRVPPQKVVEPVESDTEEESSSGEEEQVAPEPPAEEESIPERTDSVVAPIYRAADWAPIYKEEMPTQTEETSHPKTE